MNQLLIQNVSLLNSQQVLVKKDILIHGDIFSSILSPFSVPKDNSNINFIDGTNFLALPGLMNCHSHLPMVLFRGLAEDLNLEDWLIKKIFPIEKKLTEELVYYGSLVGIAELIHSGCTFFADMYFFVESIAKAVDLSGIRANLSLGLVEKNGKEGIQQAKNFFHQYHSSSDNRIQVYLGPHAPYTCNLDYLKEVSDLAKSLKTGIHIHLNETANEIKEFYRNHQKKPIKALQEINFFGTPTLGAHCVHLEEEEMDILKQEDVLVVHNPSSNSKLGSGIAPINKLLNKGVKVSLGTDGAASNNQLNMLGEMRLASLLGKVNAGDSRILSAETVFKMGTEVPGQYLLNGKTGLIKEQYKADLILIDLSQLSLFPTEFINLSMIHSLRGNEIDTMIVDGKIVMKHHQILTFDEKETVKIANQLVKEAFQC